MDFVSEKTKDNILMRVSALSHSSHEHVDAHSLSSTTRAKRHHTVTYALGLKKLHNLNKNITAVIGDNAITDSNGMSP